jgi:CRISPR-associated protein Csd1
MSWMSQLYDTYENNIEKSKADKFVMEPMAHRNKNVQVEVILDKDGNFCGARKLSEEEENTIIPVTEDSDNRTSKMIAPHMLTDSLPYVAGDYEYYCKNEEKEDAKKKFQEYIHQLEDWQKSKESHPKLDVIYRYLREKKLITDLVKAGIISLTDENLFDAGRINQKAYNETTVRFRVLEPDSIQLNGTWEDDTLIDAYKNYYLRKQAGKKDICFFSGKEEAVEEKHRKGVIKSYGNAKLVSSNDKEGFSFRGRFETPEQAYTLSYNSSQKIHNALAWLIKKQGVSVGGRIFICWSPKGKDVPTIFDLLQLEDDSQDEFDMENKTYRKKLKKSLQGIGHQFQEEDNVIVMILDATSTKSGRLSILYYNEFPVYDFFARINTWGETCNWFYKKYTEHKVSYIVKTPSFFEIVKCAFGQEPSHKEKKSIEVNDKILKDQVQRLMMCMLEQLPMPRDIVSYLSTHASRPMAYSKENREWILSTACAVIVKYYIDKGIMKGEETVMKLDIENRDRSYLFGRLLAVLEKVERVTYKGEESREPNAIRLQSAYVNHPFQTWMILEEQLSPYFQKLKPKSREYYRRLISEITALFVEDNQQLLNQSLSEMYLLGYYLQRAELNKKKDEKEEVNNG